MANRKLTDALAEQIQDSIINGQTKQTKGFIKNLSLKDRGELADILTFNDFQIYGGQLNSHYWMKVMITRDFE